MDKLDEKILLALIKNSRQTISQLAKQVRSSRDVVNYRVTQLIKKGIIRDFITTIDYQKMGYISALFFLSINAEKEAEFIDYVNSLDFVSWAGTQLGLWNLGMAIYGKNTDEVEERFQSILYEYKDYITNHQFVFYKNTEFFTEKYFGKQPTFSTKTYGEYSLDTHDKVILSSLSKNSRISSTDLSKDLPLSAVAIAQRIKKLEQSGYIQGYTIYVNVFKLDLYLFVFFIQNRKLDQRKKLITYLRNHPRVTLLLDYVGDPFIEFSIFTKDPYETRTILQEIKETFPENELIDFFLTQEDFISYGAPRCVFE